MDKIGDSPQGEGQSVRWMHQCHRRPASWPELLATNHEVPGSIPGSTMGIFLVGGGSPW